MRTILFSICLITCITFSGCYRADVETVELQLDYVSAGYVVFIDEYNNHIAVKYSPKTFNETYDELTLMWVKGIKPIYTLTKSGDMYYK